MPKVSVIIPNYNHEAFLIKRLDSVLNQSFKDFEVILLDDCSTDHSRAILEDYCFKHDFVQFYPNERNSGSPFHQWNKGVKLAKGEYIWIAESDDFCEPEFLAKMTPLLDENPGVGIAYAQSNLVDEKDQIINSYLKNLEFIYKSEEWRQNFIKNGAEANKEWLLFHNPIPNASGVLMRKKAFLEADGADVEMKLNGDWFLYAKILVNWDLAFLADHLNYFRVHDQTQRSRTYANYKIFREIIKLNEFIRNNTDGADGNADKAMKKVSGWWAGSLPHQKWSRAMLKGNRELYKAFKPYNRYFIFNIILIHLITWLRNILIALGLLKPLKKMRSRLFPGKYFEH